MKTIESITLKDLIPQRPPFVMIDKLLSCDTATTTTELKVRDDNVFVAEGRLSASGLMENIAQTCAARIGFLNDSVKIGVIGAVSNFEIFRTPNIGERIVTTIELLEEMFQITLVKAVVKSGDETLAQANMKISLLDIDAQD